jgi:DNA repair protein RecO (recombination protein O)
MPQLKSEAIILKSVNWKEQSKIITVFTDNAGMQTIIDRGGRSLKTKRGRMMTFARLEIAYFKSDKSGTGYVAESEPLETFEFEKEGTLGRLTFASAVLELLYDLLPKDEPQEELYDMTLSYLRLVNSKPKTSVIPVFLCYFLRLLSLLGYRPNFSGCIACGKDKSETSIANSNGGRFYLFSPERGGLVCSACQIAGEYYIKLQSDRLDKISSLQTASLMEATERRLKLEEAEEILELLIGFLKYQTDSKDLKSLQFLEKLKKTNLKF